MRNIVFETVLSLKRISLLSKARSILHPIAALMLTEACMLILFWKMGIFG